MDELNNVIPEKPYGIIYYAMHKTTGKLYIGKTTKTLAERKAMHERAPKTRRYKFQNALHRHGFDSFVWGVLQANIPGEDLNDVECWYIKAFESYLPEYGYNLTLGGDGVDFSVPETKANQKAGAQRNAQNPEYRANQKAGAQRMWQDPEYRANQKAGAQRNAQNPQWQANQKAAAQRRSQNPQWQAKRKAVAQRNAQDPEFGRKVKEGMANAKAQRALKAQQNQEGTESNVIDISIDKPSDTVSRTNASRVSGSGILTMFFASLAA